MLKTHDFVHFRKKTVIFHISFAIDIYIIELRKINSSPQSGFKKLQT